MNALSGNVAERCIDQPLALEPVHAGKAVALDLHGEVAFAAAIVAGMAVVACAVVDHGEVGGGERAREELFDFSG